MIYVDQTNLGDDGNCLQACLASIFEVDINDPPNDLTSNWLNSVSEYTIKKGYRTIHTIVDKDHDYWFEGCLFIIAGYSNRTIKYTHAVVGTVQNGKLTILHDPYPDKTGVDLNGEISFIVFVPIEKVFTENIRKLKGV